MIFYADMHIHSKFSRATSKNCDLVNLAQWARYKGISVLGTGDFTHPEWMSELKENLIPCETGLFRLRPELEKEVEEKLPIPCQGPIYFMLSVEISTIYKKNERTRKVHHVIFVEDFNAAERLSGKLRKIGNLHSDGRPILGLDSRNLLEIVLESGEYSYLVPAHIWTPWFSALGSKSGFDSIDDCYADLAHHIFAVETGLSSDPQMNWRVSSLDRFRLVSNSDAHSPAMLGREACVFDTDYSYYTIRDALQSGDGYIGTVEFYPEEGKYHYDGHRKCGVRFAPEQTRQNDNLCPKCGKPVTVGVMHRVEELADRPDNFPPSTAGKVQRLVPLSEILSEIQRVGSKSKKVTQSYRRLVSVLGPELSILTEIPLEDIKGQSSDFLVEAISRLRSGRVISHPGYDGEYGTIRLFGDDEVVSRTKGPLLFGKSCPIGFTRCPSNHSTDSIDDQMSHMDGVDEDVDATVLTPQKPIVSPTEFQDRLGMDLPHSMGVERTSESESSTHSQSVLAGLDQEQVVAARTVIGPVVILAGPGSGKTRTLTHRIAHLVVDHGVPAHKCLAITFTRRAAKEMNNRLNSLIHPYDHRFEVYTFHGFGLSILRNHGTLIGLDSDLQIVDQPQQLALLADTMGLSMTKASRLLKKISVAKRTADQIRNIDLNSVFQIYHREMRARNWVDFDDLIGLSVRILESDRQVQSSYQARYEWVSIDEFQDLDLQQYRLMRLLVPDSGNLCAIGDPDQAIYGFRGSDRSLFQRLQEDFPNAQVFYLSHNYRSSKTIVEASSQVIAPQHLGTQCSMALSTNASRIFIHQAKTEFAEADFIVETIESLMGGHSFLTVDRGGVLGNAELELSFSDFAILYRMESILEPICKALNRSGIPFQKRSHERLIEQPSVSEILQLLQMKRFEGSVRTQLELIIKLLADDVGGKGFMESSDSIQSASENLFPLADECGTDVSRFLSELMLGAQVDTWDPRADRVSLMTLHASKGLEFRMVFMMGCEDGILPLAWAKTEQRLVEEERRVFYVGMTRAQDGLLLSHSRQRLLHGHQNSQRPSPFLADIQEKLVEKSKQKSSKRSKKDSGGQLSLF